MTYTVTCALGNRVLVKCDAFEKSLSKEGNLHKTKSGIFLPPKNEIADQEERRQAGAEIGTIVSLGKMAFKGLGDGSNWANVGDKIVFKRYAGINPYPDGSPDGYMYRLIDDEDMAGLIEDLETK